MTFPSAQEATGPAVTFQKVLDGRYKDGVNADRGAAGGANWSSSTPATTPKRSLGVIAFSQRQQDRILDELEVLRRENPGTEAFFGEDRDDPFFVKNLENVQGDERDIIFLSVGYGPDESGKVAMRLRTTQPRRRGTAAERRGDPRRHAMTVVASMTAARHRSVAHRARRARNCSRPSSTTPSAGPRHCRCSRRRRPPPQTRRSSKPSPTNWSAADLTVQRRVGFGGYTVDIAVVDPQRNGAYILGVECDGASYRSAATAATATACAAPCWKGWGGRLVRVWSTEWVRDREKQVPANLRGPGSGPESAAEAAIARRRNWSRWRPFGGGSSRPSSSSRSSQSPRRRSARRSLGSLVELGSMPMDDLVAAVAERLGFKRTGAKIRERVTAR